MSGDGLTIDREGVSALYVCVWPGRSLSSKNKHGKWNVLRALKQLQGVFNLLLISLNLIAMPLLPFFHYMVPHMVLNSTLLGSNAVPLSPYPPQETAEI